jgi:hypothetical protein
MKTSNTKKIVRRNSPRLREMSASLRSPMALTKYIGFNALEAKYREEQPTRPVLVWTYRAVLTTEQQAAVEKMSGWNILGILHNVVADQYAIVAQAMDKSCWGIIYPTGELERSAQKRTYDVRFSGWAVSRTSRKPKTETKSVVYGSREPVPAGPVKSNTMWESIEVFATK